MVPFVATLPQINIRQTSKQMTDVNYLYCTESQNDVWPCASVCEQKTRTFSFCVECVLNKKFELMLTKCAKAYSSSGSVV